LQIAKKAIVDANVEIDQVDDEESYNQVIKII
jgi:hypothetical protein